MVFAIPVVVLVEAEGETREDAENETFLLKKGSGRVSVSSYNYQFDGKLEGVLKQDVPHSCPYVQEYPNE